MCESKIYTTTDELLMDDVIFLKIKNGKIIARDILGHEETFAGKIIKIDLEKHCIYLELK